MKLLLPIKRGSFTQPKLLAVLYIVVETGIVYTVLFVIFILIDAGVFGSEVGSYWSEFWMCQLSVRHFPCFGLILNSQSEIQGIYPTLIVVAVSLRASILEQSVANASDLATVSLHFATNGDLAVQTSRAPGEHTAQIAAAEPNNFETSDNFVDAEGGQPVTELPRLQKIV